VCARGAGNFSYRLYETMMMGRIPIIIDTDQCFPFDNILQYNEFCVIIDYTEIESAEQKIKEWLNKKSESEIEQIQNINRNVWETYMSPHGWLQEFHKEIYAREALTA
jgi:hypothetical protein